MTEGNDVLRGELHHYLEVVKDVPGYDCIAVPAGTLRDIEDEWARLDAALEQAERDIQQLATENADLLGERSP